MFFSGNFKRQIQRIKLFAAVICIAFSLLPVIGMAEEVYPQCFPMESSWDNIQFVDFPFSDGEISAMERNKRKLDIRFRNNYMTLMNFYGFTYLKNETQDIPEISNHSTLEKHFRNTKLTPLDEDVFAKEYSDRSYRFTPESQGTWVIFLVAYLNEIPFLEQQGLRIHPTVEKERGGTVFSGSSMNLAEMVDYKACVISMNE